ncbi:MAG: phage protease [Puniceicoccales bacterium]|jgi:hypothetical protein|nr:phage protease [Puniceicoccales bacterium]
MNVKWLKLVNFGEYDHPKGTQVLNSLSAKTVVDTFLSSKSHSSEKSRGIPIFIGHPDDPEFASRNGKIYGRMEDLKVADDALWATVRWSTVGRELFENGILRYLSPRWLTTQTTGGKLFPKCLLSVGLTNHPNIRCEHVSKIETIGEENPKRADLVESESSQNARCGRVSKVEMIGEEGIEWPTEKSCFEADRAGKFSEEGEKVESLPPEEASAEAENHGEKSNAPSDQKFEISSMQIVLHTVSQTEDLRQQFSNKSNCERILNLVFDRMQKFSERYNDAWMAVKRSNSALFY